MFFIMYQNKRLNNCLRVNESCSSYDWKYRGSDVIEAICGLCSKNAVGRGCSDRFMSLTRYSSNDKRDLKFAICDQCDKKHDSDNIQIIFFKDSIYDIDHIDRENM